MRSINGRDLNIQEIARRAGVGVGTVSRVLNDSPNVSEATRQHVRRVMAEAGYRPKSAAQTMRTGRANAVAFIADEVASTPFAVDTIRGAQDAAWEKGKILLLVNTNNNEQLLEAAVRDMLDRQVEGMIYATWFHRMVQLPRIVYELPTVLVDCFVEDRSLPSVVPDELTGGYAATEVLIKAGHRRIGFINHDYEQPARHGRHAGYAEALAAYGIRLDPELVCYSTADAEGGYRGVHTLLSLPQPPTAIFCFNDRMVMGAYDALRERNLRVPDDIAIVGFDNQEILAAHLRPAVTTMQLPHYAMGAWGVRFLLESDYFTEQVAAPAAVRPSAPPQVTLPCPLVLRQSHAKEKEVVRPA